MAWSNGGLERRPTERASGVSMWGGAAVRALECGGGDTALLVYLP
jgi:hypothetical protein